jgi:plasmid maintenance system antidote protein VapI
MSTSIPNYSGARLDELMTFQGRSSNWLASRLDVDQSYVSKLRSGAKPITEDLAQRISRILDVPVSFLIADEAPCEGSLA